MAEVAGVSVVIPTVGRQSLAAVLCALGGQAPPAVPAEVLVVDDRRRQHPPLALPAHCGPPVRVVRGPGGGPAAARNAGWRAARHPWVAFLDDDVVPEPDWYARLVADLTVPAGVGGVQGRVRVPLPTGRRPTDWERVSAGLAGGRWITADMAYRRSALAAVGGFDERFPGAYREDAELAHRVAGAGWRLVRGARGVVHPVRPEGPWVSLRSQRGNADDAMLRRLYGRRWREVLGLPPGRRRRHALVTAAGGVAVLASLWRLGNRPAASRRPAPRRVAAPAGAAWLAAVAGAGWLAGTGEFFVARVAPGPRTPAELAAMAVSSVLIPPLACLHWLRGWLVHRGARPRGAEPNPP